MQYLTGDEVITGQGGETIHSVEASSTSEGYLYVDGNIFGNLFAMSYQLFKAAIFSGWICKRRLDCYRRPQLS